MQQLPTVYHRTISQTVDLLIGLFFVRISFKFLCLTPCIRQSWLPVSFRLHVR